MCCSDQFNTAGKDFAITDIQSFYILTVNCFSRTTKCIVEINFYITPNLAAMSATGTVCRVLLVHDKNPTLGYPGSTGVMTTNTHLAHQNLVNKKRFTILKDVVHQMTWMGNNVAAVVAAGPEFVGKFTIYPKYEVNYQTNSGITTNITNHNWYIMTITDSGSATVCCKYNHVAQVSYTDA